MLLSTLLRDFVFSQRNFWFMHWYGIKTFLSNKYSFKKISSIIWCYERKTFSIIIEHFLNSELIHICYHLLFSLCLRKKASDWQLNCVCLKFNVTSSLFTENYIHCAHGCLTISKFEVNHKSSVNIWKKMRKKNCSNIIEVHKNPKRLKCFQSRASVSMCLHTQFQSVYPSVDRSEISQFQSYDFRYFVSSQTQYLS